MRKAVLIVATLLVLIAAFTAYLYRQPPIAMQSSRFSAVHAGAATEPAIANPLGVLVGKGGGVWVAQYDRDTGRRSYQFKADFYDPEPDGTTVRVTRPVAEFYQDDGQIVRVEGDDGIIRVAPGTDRASLGRAPAQPPRYGTLRNVVIKMFHSSDDEARGVVDIKVTMTNAEFDNDTFRLFTEEYTDPAGHVVHADEVPVNVVNKDYIFEGSGLVMYWNGLDKRLKSLDVDHARRLTIYNATGFSVESVSTKSSGPATQPAQVQAPASTAPASAPSQPAGAPVPPGSPRNRYTATFFKDVQVWQADQQLIAADKMDVDFQPKGSAPVPGSAEAAAQPAADVQPPMAETEPRSDSPPAVAVAAPATQLTAEPIDIYWKGPLHIVPTDVASAGPLDVGQSTVHLVGSPVHLHQVDPKDQKITEATCANLTYRTADAGVKMIGGAQSPLILTQRKDRGPISSVSGQELDFLRHMGVATISGEGAAIVPDPNDPKSVLHAAWNKSCIVHFTDEGKSQTDIRTAELSGGVMIEHPRFHLTSEDLTLTFDPPRPGEAGGSQLRQLDAAGNSENPAICVVKETGQQSRSVAGNQLHLFTARSGGKVYAKSILADGSVKAIEQDQTLTADHLNIALLPASVNRPVKQPKSEDENEAANVELEKLSAQGSVHVAGKNGTSADADTLQTVMVAGHPRVTLRGQPAKVVGKDSTVTGPEIVFSPSDQTSSVNGAGRLMAIQQPTAQSKKPRPMTLTWSNSAKVDGNTNEIDVNGDVNVLSKSEDGTVSTAHGQRVVMTLMDKPATQPSVPAKKHSANPAAMEGGDVDFLSNKQVRTVSLRDKAELDQSLSDAEGKLLRRSQLYGDQINYDTVEQQLTVPGSGQLRTANHMTEPAGAASQKTSLAGGHGTTWFVWEKQLVYDEAKRIGTIDGGVIVAHVDDGPNPRPVRVDADQVVAQFAPGKVAAAAAPPGQPDAPQLQLSKLTASGTVRVKTGDTTVHCGRVDFDPTTDLLKCFAGGDGIVTVNNAQYPGGATFSEVWLNTKTNTLEKMFNVNVRGRQ
jgi:hypothetical protein